MLRLVLGIVVGLIIGAAGLWFGFEVIGYGMESRTFGISIRCIIQIAGALIGVIGIAAGFVSFFLVAGINPPENTIRS